MTRIANLAPNRRGKGFAKTFKRTETKTAAPATKSYLPCFRRIMVLLWFCNPGTGVRFPPKAPIIQPLSYSGITLKTSVFRDSCSIQHDGTHADVAQ